MLNEINKGMGCLKCPVSQWECDAQYRGSRCAALRAKAGADSDPEENAVTTQNAKDDLISRQALLAEIKGPNRPDIYDGAEEVDWIMECIDKAAAVPSLTGAAPVVHGRWIRQKGHNPEAICSRCGREIVYQVIEGRWAFENYCPHCGSPMDEEGDNNV